MASHTFSADDSNTAFTGNDTFKTLDGTRIVQSGETVQAAVSDAAGAKVVFIPAGSYADTAISVPAGGEIQADRQAIFTSGADITWHYPVTYLEKGVMYPFFPRGDVRRYGVFPDGTTNWESSFGTRMTNIYTNSTVFQITWPAGFYNTNMDLAAAYSGSKMHFDEGAEFGGLIHIISSANPLTNQIAVNGAVRASAVTTITTSAAHSFVAGQTVTVYEVLDTSFNGTYVVASVPDSTHLTYAQAGLADATSGTGIIDEQAITEISWAGTLTTYDRFGTINASGFVERVHVKNDPTKHVNFPGAKARGVHIYYGTRNFRIDQIIVDDCGNSNNTDAAVSIDGTGDNPANLNIGLIWVKASDTHGVYITGQGHKIGIIRVDEYGKTSYGGTGLQDSGGLTQSQSLAGVWLNRIYDATIDTIKVNQATDTRSNALYHVLIDETGIGGSLTPNKTARGITIGNIIARNINDRGVVFVDATSASPDMYAHVRLIEAQLAPSGTVPSGYGLVTFNSPTTNGRVTVDDIRLLDISAQTGMMVSASTTSTVSITTISTYSQAAGRFAEIHGKVNIREMRSFYNAGTGTNPVVEISGAGADDSYVGEINLSSNSSVYTPAVKVATADRITIGEIRTNNFRNATGTVQIDTVTNSSFSNLFLVNSSSVNVGLYLNAIANVNFQTVYITGFATGVTKGAGTITATSCTNANVTGNTTNTTLANGSVVLMNAASFTL